MIIYTANLNYNNKFWAKKSEELLFQYALKNGLDFKCFDNLPGVDLLTEHMQYGKQRCGVYSSIYALYDFLNSSHERMAWIDLDIVLRFEDNIFNKVPNLYLESGHPEGKVIKTDRKYANQKIDFVDSFLGRGYSIFVQTGLFSMDRHYAELFLKNTENYFDFNNKKDLIELCDLMNEEQFIPNEEVFFELFVLDNNITPKRILKTLYTEQLNGNYTNLDCDIIHFCNIDGKEMLENYFRSQL